MAVQETEIRGLSRRYAQIALPGVNEPKAVSGISIPVAPKSEPKRPQRKHLARAQQRMKELPEGKPTSVEFSLFSTEEIDAYAQVNITSSEKYGPNTVRDLRMGPQNESQICDTCQSDIRDCPGHYGKIIIPRIMHPMAVNSIILVCSCVCNSCGGLLATKEEIDRAGINRLVGEKRLQAIKELVGKLKRTCQRYINMPGVRPCDPNPIYTSLRENKDDYRLSYTYASGEKKKKTHLRLPDVPITSSENSIYKILNAISEDDAFLLGFKDTHPRNMIMERMVVIPYCARPDLYQGSKFQPDDLTSMYQDIVDKVQKYNDPNASEADKENSLRDIYFRIYRFMKNDGRYTQGGAKVYNDLKKRIQGKTAIVRSNLMGKRLNFAGRTVVGPAAYYRVDEIGIPRLMAVKLTRPIRVTEMNRAELQSKYDNNMVRHITMKAGPSAGARVMVNDSLRQRFPDYRLNLGDVVERVLEDGDLVLFNRQPTLHKQSIMAAYAKIINDRVVRINLSVTTPLNADFDGDEINVHVPQTPEAYAEAEQLLLVSRNLMSSESNRPMMGIVYDSLSGAYLITYPQHEFEKLAEKVNPTAENIARLNVLKSRIILDPIIFNQSILPVADSPQMATLWERVDKYGIDRRTGRALISAAFPAEFNYKKDDGKGNLVLIKEGVLIKGYLSKDTLGNKDGSIIGEMYKQLGGSVTVDFMSEIQFIIREFLQQHGLSVGINDCVPENSEFRKEIDQELTTATMKVITLTQPTPNKIMAQKQEQKIVSTLKTAKDKTEETIQKYFKPDNAILVMANSGAKGTSLNSVQMASVLGQQMVSGTRIKPTLAGNRALPVFEPNDPDPRAKGFCYNSFSSGLEPSEFFNHAQGGREGLTDTAVNTARTGFLQHQMIKSTEDIHISSEGATTSADGAYIEFVPGGDGMDPSELGAVKIKGESVPFFRNIELIAAAINTKYT